MKIPNATIGYIGGSGTWSAQFPEAYHSDQVRMLEYLPSFVTPHGESAPFKLLEIAGQRVLRVSMHGAYPDESRMILPEIAAKQTAWVFAQAGTKYVVSEASVGGIQDLNGNLLPPWSVLTPHDFYKPWPPSRLSQTIARGNKSVFYRMADPFCPALSQLLAQAATEEDALGEVFPRGIYACTPWGRFETPFEIEVLKNLGANVVGQTSAHEAIELRNHGIHFAVLNIVSNHAEGRADWTGSDPQAMEEFYKACAEPTGNTMIRAITYLANSPNPPSCKCATFGLPGLGQFPVSNA